MFNPGICLITLNLQYKWLFLYVYVCVCMCVCVSTRLYARMNVIYFFTDVRTNPIYTVAEMGF